MTVKSSSQHISTVQSKGYCAKSNLKGVVEKGGGAFAVSPSITVLSLSNSEGGPSTTADYRVIKSGANVNEGFL